VCLRCGTSPRESSNPWQGSHQVTAWCVLLRLRTHASNHGAGPISNCYNQRPTERSVISTASHARHAVPSSKRIDLCI